MASDQLVSIIIPMFNAELYLAETLESIKAQSHQNWECLLIDDGSSDSTAEVSKNYSLADSRFSYHKQENAGPSAARNNGLRMAKGAFIQFFDSDDVMVPNRLESLLDEYQKADNKTVLFSQMLIGDHDNIQNTRPTNRGFGEGRDLGFNELYAKFGIDFLFIPGTVLFPSSAAKDVRWNEQSSHSEDFEFYLNVAKRGFSFKTVAQPLTIYRDSPNSLSKQTQNTAQANYDIYRRWLTKGNEYVYARRCAHQFHRGILLYLRGQQKTLVWPTSSAIGETEPGLLARLMVYPLTLRFLIKAILKI